MNKHKLIMTYLVRNEDDIIEDSILYHFSQGVDQFIVTDNLSTDTTREVISRLSDEIPIDYIFQDMDNYNQSEWVTLMARRGAVEHGATWIINSDADEFWVPTHGTLKELIEGIDDAVGEIRVSRHNAAVIRWNNVKPFNAKSHPSMSTAFETQSLNSIGGPLPPKVMHRANDYITVHQGNHRVSGVVGKSIQDSANIKILHFPYQSLRNYKSKIILGGAAYARNTDLPEGVGDAWRKEYLSITSGDLNSIWEGVSKTKNDVFIETQNGTLFENNLVRDFLDKTYSNRSKFLADNARENLVSDTKESLDVVRDKLIKTLSLQPEGVRRNLPLYYNIKYSLQGPTKQLSIAKKIESDYSFEFLTENFSFLRDAYSIFPGNLSFKGFIGSLYNYANYSAAKRLSRDCLGRIVILHVTCEKYTDRAIDSVNSFLSKTEGKYHHIIVKGVSSAGHESIIPMTFEYDGLFLTVPVPDSYEALNRKVFNSLMAINLTSRPSQIVKMDDDLHLDDFNIFDRTLEDAMHKEYQYCGRRVGARAHSDQWHGWHVGKCLSEDIEDRGYTYPLPKSYAAGGYGYILGPRAINVAANMYLGMKEFFEMNSIGLEDAYIGHAMYAENIEIVDISNSTSMRAIPGLKIRDS